MAQLAYDLTFAGIPFVSDRGLLVRLSPQEQQHSDREQKPPRDQQSLGDLVDEINRRIPFDFLRDFSATPDYPGRNLGALASKWQDNFPTAAIKIGQWYYPTGANRWSVFRGLATSTMAKQMLAATGGSQAKTFKMKAFPISPSTAAETSYSLSTEMYMLPPRPLAEHGGAFDGLYLITLVDERYYFDSPISLRVTFTTTWSSLISQIAASLGRTITCSAIPAAYGQPEPDSQLWTNQEDIGFLLDAVAYNIGRVVVRALDGTYSLLTPQESRTIVLNNRGNVTAVVRTAGGDIFASGGKTKAGNLTPARNAVTPAQIVVAFPKYVVGDDPVPHFANIRYPNQRPSTWYEQSYGDTFAVTVPIQSGSSLVSGLSGTSTGYIHSTAKALLSGDVAINSGTPLNSSGLTSLAMQIAGDYWDAQVAAALDEVYPGIYAWTPEGLHDIVWTYSSRQRQGTTRVLKTEWNSRIAEMQHAAASLSGQANTPKGVGGPSVAQSWRDSASGEIVTSLASGLPSGNYQAFFNAVSYFPTQNRWRGQIDNEKIFFEGTSGGVAVGIVYRGIDGTLVADHNSGATVTQILPDATYGVNLVTFEKGQHVFPQEWNSGGIQGVRVVPQVQTVQVLSASGVLLNSIDHYSGLVDVYDTTAASGSQFRSRELCWVTERNAVILLSGKYYAGQYVGVSVSGQVAPVYAVNEFPPGSGGGSSSGTAIPGSGAITSGMLGSGAVNSGNISSGAVSWFTLGSGVVREAHISSGAVSFSKIGSGAIVSGHITSGALNNVNASFFNWSTTFNDQVLITNAVSDTITADQNDYNPAGLSTTSVLRITTNNTWTITGLQGGADGRLMVIQNVGSNNLILSDEDGLSLAANRFTLNGNKTIYPSQALYFRYSATTSRWCLLILTVTSGSICSGALCSGLILGQSLGGDLHAFTHVSTTTYYYAGMQTYPTSFTNANLQSGFLYAMPLWAPRGGSLDQIVVSKNNNSSGANLRLGVYNNTSTADLRPSTLVVDGGEQSVSGTGNFTFLVSGSASLSPGKLYWLAFVCNNANPQWQTVAVANLYPILGTSGLFTAGNAYYGWATSNGYGSLPANFPSSPTPANSPVPGIAYRFYA